jgi:hypothetical protein
MNYFEKKVKCRVFFYLKKTTTTEPKTGLVLSPQQNFSAPGLLVENSLAD